MQAVENRGPFKLGDQDALDAALLHADPHIQIQARSLASGWHERLQAWMNDELRRGKENTAFVPLVITSQAAQVLASFIVQSIRESGHDDVARHLAETFSEKLPEAVAIFRAARSGEKKQ